MTGATFSKLLNRKRKESRPSRRDSYVTVWHVWYNSCVNWAAAVCMVAFDNLK